MSIIDFSFKFTNYIHTFNISNIAILAIFAITSAKFPIKTPSVAKKSSKMPTFAKAKKEISSSTVAEIDKFCSEIFESQYLGSQRVLFVMLTLFCKRTLKTQYLFWCVLLCTDGLDVHFQQSLSLNINRDKLCQKRNKHECTSIPYTRVDEEKWSTLQIDLFISSLLMPKNTICFLKSLKCYPSRHSIGVCKVGHHGANTLFLSRKW